DLIVAWYRTVTDSTAPNLLDPENISFATMWTKWIGASSVSHMLALATCAAAMAMVGAAGLMRRRVTQPDFLEVSLLLFLVPLISPQGWDYVLVLGVPLIMCEIDRWSTMPIAWRAISGASIAIMNFTVFDIVGRTLYVGAMKYSVISLAAMA